MNSLYSKQDDKNNVPYNYCLDEDLGNSVEMLAQLVFCKADSWKPIIITV